MESSEETNTSISDSSQDTIDIRSLVTANASIPTSHSRSALPEQSSHSRSRSSSISRSHSSISSTHIAVMATNPSTGTGSQSSLQSECIRISHKIRDGHLQRLEVASHNRHGSASTLKIPPKRCRGTDRGQTLGRS